MQKSTTIIIKNGGLEEIVVMFKETKELHYAQMIIELLVWELIFYEKQCTNFEKIKRSKDYKI